MNKLAVSFLVLLHIDRTETAVRSGKSPEDNQQERRDLSTNSTHN